MESQEKLGFSQKTRRACLYSPCLLKVTRTYPQLILDLYVTHC